MKKLIAILANLLIILSVFAQAPEKMSYQAVARDLSGLPLMSTSVNLQFDILEGSATGPVTYSESQTKTTNQFGLFTAEIGGGTPLSGSFSGITWGTNAYYLKITVDGDAMPATQLLSVPYALYSKTSGVTGPTLVAGPGIDITGGVITSTLDTSETNELQILSTSATNDTIFLSEGGFAYLPPSTSTELIDGDGDTQVLVDSNSLDDDIIHFINAGVENIRIKNGRLEFVNNGGSVYIGDQSGASITTGSGNTFVGSSSGGNTTSGFANTALGENALRDLSTGLVNTAIGTRALESNTFGSSNIAVGLALPNLTSGNGNIAIGQQAGDNFISGDDNIFIGRHTGSSNTNGSGNVFIGDSVGFNEMGSNKLYIGAGSSSSPLIFGDLIDDSLKINGSLSIIDGTQGLNKVLTSDANGNADWQNVPLSPWTKIGTDLFPTAINDNVGIGTNSPSAKLHTFSTSQIAVRLESSSNLGTWFEMGNSTGQVFSIISTGTSNSEGAAKLLFNRNSGFGTSTGAIMTLDHATANVGFGTSSPQQLLTLSTLNSTTLRMERSTPAAFDWEMNVDNFGFHLKGGADGTGGALTEFINVDGTGRMGIGTATPSAKMHIANNTDPNSIEVYNSTNSAITSALIFGNNNGTGSGPKIGVQLTANGTGGNENYGASFAAANALLENRGIVTNGAASVASNATGILATTTGNGTGVTHAVYGENLSSATGAAYGGRFRNFSNTGALVFGIASEVSSTSTNAQYGIRADVYGAASSGVRYGIYTAVTGGITNWAAFFATGDVFVGEGLVIPTGAGAGLILTSDAAGNATWQSSPGAFETTTNITSNSPGDYTNDHFVFGSPQLDDDNDPNHDNRFFFNKSKGAFRAGNAYLFFWDDANVGVHSVAFNTATWASGLNSTAFGFDNQASGNQSFTMGQANVASSLNETAIGMFGTTPGGNATTFVPTDKIFSVGNGTATLARSDAFVILKNGNTAINGALTIDGAYTLPVTDAATAGDVLTSDAAGNVSWQSAGGGGGLKGSGTSTQLAFWGASDSLTSSTDLYWDNTTTRLGIGTNAPGAGLAIRGNGLYDAGLGIQNTAAGMEWRLTTDNGGNLRFVKITGATFTAMIMNPVTRFVGIGTTNPSANLDVTGITKTDSLIVTTNSGTAGEVLTNDGTGNAIWGPAGAGSSPWNLNGSDINYTAGNVGIGTATPTSLLTINTLAGPEIAFVGISNADITSSSQLNLSSTNGVVVDANNINLRTAFSDRLVITNGGNVGIGTAAPTGGLHSHIVSPFTPALVVTNGNITSNTAAVVQFDANSTLTNAFKLQRDGNIGIGTGSPGFKLDVAGDINTSDVYRIDGITFLDNLNDNTLVGETGNTTLTGSENIFVGTGAGNANSTGGQNVALGDSSSTLNSLGWSNVAVGFNALHKNTTSGNTAVGFRAMQENTSGIQNVGLGILALASNVTGNSNSAIGNGALEGTLGNNNTGLGYHAGHLNTTGTNNTFIGHNANVLAGQTNLTNATAIGSNAIVNTSNSLILGNNANVGIGTSAPTAKLEINGTQAFEKSTQNFIVGGAIDPNISSYVELTGLGTGIVPLTISNGVTEGQMLYIICRNTALGMAIPAGGNLKMSSSPFVMNDYDSITFLWMDNNWVEMSRSDNN